MDMLQKTATNTQNGRDNPMAMRRERMRLGDLLIKQDVLTEENLKKALELQKGTGKKIGEVLVENGFITAWSEDNTAYRNHDSEGSTQPGQCQPAEKIPVYSF